MSEPERNPIDVLETVRVDDIEIGDRLRQPDKVWAEALGNVMAREGQRTPIEICPNDGDLPWLLVAGAHRVLGARKQGIEYLKAIVVSGNNIDRKRAEISENLWRRDLDPLDRAESVLHLVELERARIGLRPDQSARAAGAMATNAKKVAKDASATVSVAYKFADNVAEAVGLSERTVYRDLALVRNLSPVAVDGLRSVKHAVLQNVGQLKALAKMEPTEQQNVVSALLGRHAKFSDKPAKSIAEAVAGLSSRKPMSPEEKRLNALIGAFSRMSVAEKKGAMPILAPLMPTGWTLVGPADTSAIDALLNPNSAAQSPNVQGCGDDTAAGQLPNPPAAVSNSGAL